MSLGINAIWRARPQRTLGLLIPREWPLVLRPRQRPPRICLAVPVTSSLFSTRAHLRLPETSAKDAGTAFTGTEEGERQQDDVDEPSEPSERRPVRPPEVVGQTEEARELRDWLSEAPKRERKKEKGPSHLDPEEILERELERELERSKLAQSVFVKPARTYPNKKETRKSWRAHQASVSTQVYYDRNFQNLTEAGIEVNPASTDWRDALAVLYRNTPVASDEWIEDGMKIELAKDKFDAIMEDGGDEKIGSIRRRTGASIKVSSADAPGAPSSLLVSGTRAAINAATAEFRRIAGRITITRLWADLGPGEARTESFSEDDFFVPPLAREEGGLWQRVKVDYSAYKTAWPVHMSFASFERYVASLTDSAMLPHLNSPLYNPTKHAVLLDHERAVARRLQRAFTNRDAKPWISCAALKLALSFLCRSGDKFLPEARGVYNSMDRFGLRMDADVFNLLLRAPAAARNLRKFRRTVISMRRKGLHPNLDTWILFLRMFESVEVKSHVLRAMNDKNLLATPEAVRRVAEEMARFDAEHAMGQGKDLAAFLAEQDERYGADWLTRDAANPVLDVLCRHGRFADAFALLDRMKRYLAAMPPERADTDRIPYKPDTASYNTIISHARTQGRVPAAVNAARRMKRAGAAAQPGRDTFELLFDIAWRARLRCAVGIVWRYACLARLTTWRMRQRVAGLIRGPPARPQRHRSSRTHKRDGDEKTVHDISAAAYAQLGGEALARDLAGGGARALARVRRLGEGRHASELGVLAARCWPEAFGDAGPAVALGEVLAQAVLRDLECLGAVRGRKKEKDTTTGVGVPAWVEAGAACVLPLRARRGPAEVGAGDLAPLVDDDAGGGPIGVSDRWALDDGLFAGVGAGEEGPRMMAILDPGVWADEFRGGGGGGGGGEDSRDIEGRRHEVQVRNEDDVLAALDRLEGMYSVDLRKVVSVDGDEGGDGGFGWPGDGEWDGEWRRVIGSDEDVQVEGAGDACEDNGEVGSRESTS
ncbi:hypothetical protein KVR01_011540 [Diaporthe batatas]|uniref:uncharacterized protein n=1 Tax=Diaporthe batatas TaxID=748121 RepID=UPI001D05780D|nr:uncharacterized protein KVR01_011540 [Diaporthe batatas]KAG8158418.1 hypothetical protein KVR01_011540 [Diaporthe batatas]